jgi:hypothetical protein
MSKLGKTAEFGARRKKHLYGMCIAKLKIFFEKKTQIDRV